jgi:hypothetical protein
VRYLTIRSIPADVGEALERVREASTESLNRVVIDLLGQALGVRGRGGVSNGLAGLAGTWSREEQEDFEAATASTEQIDDELWR